MANVMQSWVDGVIIEPVGGDTAIVANVIFQDYTGVIAPSPEVWPG